MEDQQTWLNKLLNKLDDTFTVEAPKSIELDSYAGFEDLYEKFDSQENRGLGFRKTVNQRIDNYQGKPGTISISHKDKYDYSIKFWPDMGKEWVDEQNLSIYRAGVLANAPQYIAPIAAAKKAYKRSPISLTKKPPRNITPTTPVIGGKTNKGVLNPSTSQIVPSGKLNTIEWDDQLFLNNLHDDFVLEEGEGTDTPDPYFPSLALEGKETFFAKGETKRIISAGKTTGQEVTPKIKNDWVLEGKIVLARYEEKLGINVGKTENHHAGVIRQIFEATNGLTQEYRTRSSNYMSHRLGIALGYSKENAFPIPIRFHPRIHALVNKRISRGPGYNLKGIEDKFNLPSNWQETFTYRQRLPIYNEIISTLGDSIKQIDIFWQTLQSRTDLGKGTLLNKEEYMDIVLNVLELDQRLLNAPSPPIMKRGDLGWTDKDTATEIINEILTNAGKADLTLPIFKPLDKTLTKEALSIVIQENGWKALREAVVSQQSAATIFQTYNINVNNKTATQVVNEIKLDGPAYQHMLRSRGKSIRFVDERGGMNPDD